jgi:hypothetical protein
MNFLPHFFLFRFQVKMYKYNLIPKKKKDVIKYFTLHIHTQTCDTDNTRVRMPKNNLREAPKRARSNDLR